MNHLHFVLSLMGLSMLLPIQKSAKGGGGVIPPAITDKTWYFLGF